MTDAADIPALAKGVGMAVELLIVEQLTAGSLAAVVIRERKRAAAMCEAAGHAELAKEILEGSSDG